MTDLKLANELDFKVIKVQLTLSVGKGFDIISGFTTETVLGYKFNDNFSLEKNESDLKNVMYKAVIDKLKCLPYLMEKKNEFYKELHFHGNLEEELVRAFNESSSEKVYPIYLCIH